MLWLSLSVNLQDTNTDNLFFHTDPVDLHPSAVVLRCEAVAEESELGSDPLACTGSE